ncbi:MAG: response regulator [Lewinellaceae bacterium]|nr:response regulator [Lewinellaceae bacterium]
MKPQRFLTILLFLSAVLSIQAQDINGLPKLYPAYSEDFSNYSSFPSTCFQNCFQDQDGRLWLIPCLSASAHASLHLFQFDGYDFRNVQGEIENLPADVHIIGVNQQRSTLIWYATEPIGNQLFFYDLQTHRLRKEEIHLTGHILSGVITPDNRILLTIKQARECVIAEWADGQLMELGSLKHSEDLGNGISVIQLDDQEVWVFIQNTGDYITRFNFRNNTVKKYFFSDFKPNGVPPAADALTVILPGMPQDQIGGVYFFLLDRNKKQTTFTLYKFQKEKDLIERVEGQPDGITGRSRVFRDDSGSHLFLYAGEDKQYKAILQDTSGRRYDYSAFFSDLGENNVYSILSTDFKDRLILCSDKGIFEKQGINKEGIKYLLEGVSIRAMIELPDQKVLVSQQNPGNFVLDLKSNTTATFKVPGCPFDIQGFPTAFYYDQEGKLLSYNGDVFIKYDTSTQICESFFPGAGPIKNFTPVDADQVALLSGEGRLSLFRFSTHQLTPVLNKGAPVQISGFPNGMLYDQKGRLWVASNTGLWKVNVAKQEVEVLGKEAPFLDSRFLAIRSDEKGRLWLGTTLGGVHIYDPDTKELIVVNSDNGLANNTVANILEDEDGDWWLGTYNGISIVNKQGELITNLGVKDGLIEMESNRFASHRTGDGKLLIGTVNGLYVIDPKIIKDHIRQSGHLKVYLTSLEYFDTRKGEKTKENFQLNDIKTLRLPPSNRFLNLSLALSSYFNPQKNQYAYMLEGVDDDWTFLDNQHLLSLNNLPPGKYRLLIKGRDADGQWTEEPLALSIHAREFFYKTAWFYLLIILLVGLTTVVWIWRLRTQINLATEQIRADKAIIETQADQLKEKDKAKSLFFTNISHEFRTPLTVISGMANQIVGQDKIKDLIKRNSLSLLNMVNQILDLRKLELGKLKLDLVQGNIVQYLQYVLASYEAIAELKRVKLHFLPKEQEIIMDFDQEKFMRIISNLLSNAIKFTPKDGHIYLILEKGTINQGPDHPVEALTLTVSDTGIGIPKEQQGQIFDRFFQVKEDAAGNVPKGRSEGYNLEMAGTGIGLALTKDLITLMGGSISLESTPGKGSTFSVMLPISREAMKVDIEKLTVEDLSLVAFDRAGLEKEMEPALPKTSSAEKSSDLSLLIIEDNKDIQQYLTTLLESKYTLYLAGDGEEGIEMAFEHIPDLIVSDVMMPKKDGFEVCDTLKNDDRTSHIPIVLLTAKGSVESRIEGLERGADAYLSKPFNEKELFVRLEKLAELRRLLQQRYQHIRPLAPDAVQAAPETGFEKEDAIMAKLQKIVEDNLDDTDFGPTQLCKAMGMSRSHLHLKIKALTNLSTSIFIRTIRLHKAKELLQQGELNVTQVALEVGFNDLSYFSRKFTEEFGVNPQKVVPLSKQ